VRSERRRDLLRLLHEGRASRQQDIVAELRAAGHLVTQATVSRDLKEIGATKIREGRTFVYRLPDDVPRLPTGDLVARNLARTLKEFAVDVRPSSSLVVVLTAPGHAGAVARAIDLAGPEEVVGTVAGDDTIFVATPEPAVAEQLARRWLTSSESTGDHDRPPRPPVDFGSPA
jgi:transcriptional regulator of arginine metabolism